ncbi:bifunctional diaminohydroxyphosphoribosylaminopyrimidine deaminase/5-amino-6-(5-phosphoribosylamino)uracil reductase RibD [Soonwooa sp.]|uniref:bifunctional diaminohydroxyphosphoribosylaminopyrimidine deaminase/5-amino-6-(5-phosphoribosylamino)uracil reductase RibD n=1 Tax=Soonwooa sp. TaxID=1938592 RepID=UPI0028A76A71|nr:bifunctional diaminohydroxyphosphoribosylaminopyrimidine deaminase/5-amino-6-(5-phosphoribosylamino)uracil reductase RibD [Soonwooa sp.]
MTDKFYLQRCIQLAEKAIGKTYPNPMVGAVIVHNDRIIGEGYHKKAGEAHAEINAINSVKDEDFNLLKESTIYVSLEPCAHFGKTPPCALKIKEIGFKKVVIGIIDSHDKVSGKGIKIIEDAGISVESGILEQESLALNKRFFTFHQKRRPYIILKWAESSDGFMDKNFQPTQISDSLCKQFVHKMRSEEHAILVGKNTALHDNPSLTTREVTGRNPIRILIDFKLEVPENFTIFNQEAETIVFNSEKNEIKNNIQFIKIEKENFVQNLMEKLFELNIQSVLVEGGCFTLQQFINSNIWDETFVLKNPDLKLQNGTKAPIFNFKTKEKIDFRDNIMEYYINPNNNFI